VSQIEDDQLVYHATILWKGPFLLSLVCHWEKVFSPRK
jgi:hypothetical protein